MERETDQEERDRKDQELEAARVERQEIMSGGRPPVPENPVSEETERPPVPDPPSSTKRPSRPRRSNARSN